MSAAGEIYALLIGINHYERDSVRKLQFAVADVLSFREMLRNRMGLKDANCVVLSSPRTDAAPTPSRAEVLRLLARLSKAHMGPEDTFILYFAGHGFAPREKSFLLTVDSDPLMPELLEETAVSLDTLTRFARQIGAGQQLWILDACRNEPTTLTRDTASHCLDAAMTRDIVALARDGTTSPRAHVLQARAILSACWEGQVSYEYPVGKQSWFCHNLLSCLQEHAREELDVAELAERVRKRMHANAWQELPEAGSQSPHIVVEGRPVRLRLSPSKRSELGNEPTHPNRRDEDDVLPTVTPPSTIMQKWRRIRAWFGEHGSALNTCPRCLALNTLTFEANPAPDQRNPECQVVRCSECGYQIRPLYRQMDRVCLPAVGYRNSGKTLWLCMFHQQVRLGQANKGAARFERASSLGESDAQFDAILATVLEHREPGRTDSDPARIPSPLVFQFSGGKRFARNSGLLNIFDFDGAALYRGHEGSKLQQRALNMDGFLYFLDPTGNFAPEHPGKLPGDLRPATPEAQNEVLRHFREQVRIARRIPFGQPVKVPVAICITKMDLLPQTLRLAVEKLQETWKDDVPTLKTIRCRHEWFLKHRELCFPGWNIEEQFDELFTNRFMFFPLTSVGFGELGEESLTKRNYRPFGIIEPVLWLLHMNGFRVLA